MGKGSGKRKFSRGGITQTEGFEGVSCSSDERRSIGVKRRSLPGSRLENLTARSRALDFQARRNERILTLRDRFACAHAKLLLYKNKEAPHMRERGALFACAGHEGTDGCSG